MNRHPFTSYDRALLEVIWFGRCVYCGEALPLTWEPDHLDPIYSGGSNKIRNVTPACPACNRRKGARTAEQFGNTVVRHIAARVEEEIAAFWGSDEPPSCAWHLLAMGSSLCKAQFGPRRAARPYTVRL